MTPQFFAVAMAAGLMVTGGMALEKPAIDHIERFGTDQVTIHFDTAANRTYVLQYTTDPFRSGNAIVWSNLFVAPSIPFPNHFIIVDTATNQHRFYRLSVTP